MDSLFTITIRICRRLPIREIFVILSDSAGRDSHYLTNKQWNNKHSYSIFHKLSFNIGLYRVIIFLINYQILGIQIQN